MSTKRSLVIAGAFLVAGAATPVGAGEAVPPVPPPGTATVGVYVDSHDGTLAGVIDCGKGQRFSTVDGDATLFLAAVRPGRTTCTITLRKVAG